jgi:hypothetical protein
MYCLERFKSPDSQISLIGFTFNGHHCHPWEREAAVVKELDRDGAVRWIQESGRSAYRPVASGIGG